MTKAKKKKNQNIIQGMTFIIKLWDKFWPPS